MLPLSSSHQQCHLAFISEYNSRLVDIPGMPNHLMWWQTRCPAPNSGIATAVAAPCCPAVANKAPFDLRGMAHRQILCTQVRSLLSSKELHIVTQKVGNMV